MKRGLLYTFLAQAPTLLLFFVSSTLMTRMLGDEGRGEYALITNQVALLTLLLSLNVNYGISYFASRNGPTREVVGTAVALLLVNLFLAPALLALLRALPVTSAVLMPERAGHWMYWGFVYVSIMLALFTNCTSAVLLSQKRFRELNQLSILSAALSALGFTSLFLLRHHFEAGEMLAATLIITLSAQLLHAVAAAGLYAMHIRLAPRPIWSLAASRPIIAFSLVAHLSNLVNMVTYRFDVWVVDQYHGAADLGLYAAAVGIAQLLFYVPEPLSRVVQPYLFGQKGQEGVERFKAVARVNFTTVLVLSAGLGLAAPWAITLLYGDVFAGSVNALWLLLPGIVLNSGFKLLAQLVVQGGLQRYNLLGAAIGAALTIVLDLALIPRFGIEGAALASTLAYAAVLGVTLHALRNRMGVSLHGLFIFTLADWRALRSGKLFRPSSPS